MKLKALLSLMMAAVLLLVNSVAMSSAKPETISPTQKQAIEVIIEEYIINNPEVLVKASQVLQQRQKQAQTDQARKAIRDNAQELLSNSSSPVMGNEQGKVALIEFFDYQCVHCKRMTPAIEALVKENPDLKVIYKEFPIFGGASQYASKAALAARQQGMDKYKAFHQALMAKKDRLNKEIILETAKSVGLNMEKLKEAIDSEAVQKNLDQNMQLAEKMGIRFTPVFVVTANPMKEDSQPAYVPGAAAKEALQKLIDKAKQ